MDVFLNGEFVSESQAVIPVLDRGFIFGDGVYEVIPVFDGVAFRCEQHIERLKSSLESVRIASPFPADKWQDVIGQVVRRNGGGFQSIYIQVTRGVARRDHVLTERVEPTVLVMSTPMARDYQPAPVTAVTLRDIRWERCNIKSISLLPNVLLRQQATDAGAYEAILIRDGYLTEGAASNVFVVIGGVICTPPLGPYLLPGITRDLVLELCDRHRMRYQVRQISEKELQGAEEIWLTSSSREILPVVALNGIALGDGKVGANWSRILGYYKEFKLSMVR